MFSRFILFVGFLCSLSLGKAQELNFSVSVRAPSTLGKTDPRVIKTMEKEIKEFLNNTKWTTDEFEPEERIEGNLLINLTSETSQGGFTADLTIQVIRPVFNASYKTKLLNYKDKINFGYIENQPIRNSKEKYFDNLSSVLTFYAYMALGYDYDSFSPLGGDKYFTIANNMVQGLPSNVKSLTGWSSSASANKKKNRYWMVENIFNPRMRKMREAWYNYHRLGLDRMHDNQASGQAAMLSAVKAVKKANEVYPNAMFVQIFADAKNDELIEVFLGAGSSERKKLYNTIIAFDPFRASKYGQLNR